MNANPDKTADISSVEISNHAKLRWLQRASTSAAANVTEEIRRRLADATPTTEQIESGRGWRCGDLIIVTDNNADTVKTVLNDFEGGDGR